MSVYALHLHLVLSVLYNTVSLTVSFQSPAGCSPHVCTDINGQSSNPFSERSLGLLDSNSVSVPISIILHYSHSATLIRLQLLSVSTFKSLPLCYPSRLCRSAWVRFSVCLFVCHHHHVRLFKTMTNAL